MIDRRTPEYDLDGDLADEAIIIMMTT